MLGSFELLHPIGEGGMGAVWKGRHPASGRFVAIKVLLGHLATNPQYLEGFHREVRATASLSHPGIVTVLDYGTVSAQAARAHQDLKEGSLWLAMEYVEGGSLEDKPIQSWTELRILLVELLDALAHSHARELVHRDLKPANVLYRPGDSPEERGRWMLTDFGIAHVRDPTVSERTADINSVSAGTPLFMAPEQLLSNWRDYGPWTDLYALGCMSYLLTCGRPPFVADNFMAIALKHVSEEAPPLSPQFPVPPGFENWVRRLLSKSIGDRYIHAADACADLVQLGDPLTEASPSRAASTPSGLNLARTLTFSGIMDTFLTAPEPLDLSTQMLESGALQEKLKDDQLHRRPPTTTQSLPAALFNTPVRQIQVPSTWRHPFDDVGADKSIQGTGKGLFGLRRISFVGRLSERDHLWKEFRRACESKQPRCVIVHGGAGLGKTRLMDWLATRAQELGLATALRATHSPIMNASEGLPRMFQSYLGATGLERKDLLTRLQTVHESYFHVTPDELYLGALVEWMHPHVDGQDLEDEGIKPASLESPLERYTLATDLLRHIATRRPTVLCIDDGQWGQDSLGFAHHLLSTVDEPDLPLLIVITVRDEQCQGRLVEQEFLKLLGEQPATSKLALQALDSAGQRALLARLIGLDETLERRVEQRTNGSPLFALQLIEDWVRRDALQATDRGYVLASEEELPTDLDTLLERRIVEFLARLDAPQEASLALETAAALGIDVEDDEWKQVCAAQNLTVSRSFLDELMIAGLAIPRDGGWRFRLPSYRDCIERLSQRDGRWARVNEACAETITTTSENGTCLAERKARHYLAANQPDLAADLLWKAVEGRMRRSAYIQALGLVSLLENSCFPALSIGKEHPEQARAQLARAEALRYRGDFHTARALLEEILQWPAELPVATRANTHRVLASLLNFAGETDLASAHYGQAIPLFGTLGDDRGLARTYHGLGWVHTVDGDLPASMQSFQKGYDHARHIEEWLEAAWCLHGLAEAHANVGDNRAAPLAEQAFNLFESVGCRSGMALALRTSGDIVRWSNDFELAREIYRRARYYAQSSGHVLAVLSGALLGFCDLGEGEFETAERRFKSLMSLPQERIFPVFRPFGPLGMLVVTAHKEDWESFDKYLHVLSAVPVRVPISREICHLAGSAARICEEKGQSERAARAFDLAAKFVPRRAFA